MKFTAIFFGKAKEEGGRGEESAPGVNYFCWDQFQTPANCFRLNPMFQKIFW